MATKALAVKETVKPTLKEAEKALKLAQEYYVLMQKNWFLFAKEIKVIRDAHMHDVLKAESFQKLCDREFPQVAFSTISKFIYIVDSMGDQIEKRIESPDYKLPSYEACYRLTTLDGKLDDKEIANLKKQTLDNKYSWNGLRARLDELLAKNKKAISKATDEDVTRYQKELHEELKDDDSWDEDEDKLADDFEPDDEDIDAEDIEARDVSPGEATVVGLGSRVDYLIDNVPEFVEQLESVDGKTKGLVKKMKKLVTVLEEAIETIEE